MGFGVWEGGSHRASARWMDVVRVSIRMGGAMSAGGMCLALRVRDGADILVHDALPGFRSFLAAAETRLPGMQPLNAWWPEASLPAAGPDERVIFERRTLG